MKWVDIALRTDPATARQAAGSALEARRFRLTWQDDWSAVAERGSRVGNVVAGAFAQYFKVGFRIVTGPQGETVVRLEKETTGWAGGYIGVRRAEKNMESLRDEIAGHFQQQGLLVWVNAQ